MMAPVLFIMAAVMPSALPGISAQAYVVASADGKRVYLAHNAHQIRSIASLSKLVAAMVVLDRGLDLDGRTVMRPIDWEVARGGCRTRLRVNRSYRNEDLLYAAIISSDNRAISALGRAVGYSPSGLTAAMNRKARALGLRRTRFVEPTGISHDNVSTAWEMLAILRGAYRYPVLRRVMSAARHVTREIGTRRQIVYVNTNVFARSPRWRIVASKTGFNDSAMYCLAFTYRDRRLGLVSVVVLGASSKWARFRDARALIREARRIAYSGK